MERPNKPLPNITGKYFQFRAALRKLLHTYCKLVVYEATCPCTTCRISSEVVPLRRWVADRPTKTQATNIHNEDKGGEIYCKVLWYSGAAVRLICSKTRLQCGLKQIHRAENSRHKQMLCRIMEREIKSYGKLMLMDLEWNIHQSQMGVTFRCSYTFGVVVQLQMSSSDIRKMWEIYSTTVPVTSTGLASFPCSLGPQRSVI